MSKKNEEYMKVRYSLSDKEPEFTLDQIDDFLCDWFQMVINDHRASIDINDPAKK